MAVYGLQHEYQRERAMYEQIAMAFDISGMIAVEVDEMGVERERGEAEKQSAIGCDGMRKLRFAWRYRKSVMVLVEEDDTYDPST
jgi:hypothetical protein